MESKIFNKYFTNNIEYMDKYTDKINVSKRIIYNDISNYQIILLNKPLKCDITKYLTMDEKKIRRKIRNNYTTMILHNTDEDYRKRKSIASLNYYYLNVRPYKEYI